MADEIGDRVKAFLGIGGEEEVPGGQEEQGAVDALRYYVTG